MSRKLFITSDISVDERLASVAETSSEAGLLWPWLLTALDDWGRSTAEPKRLKYTVFPAFARVTPQAIADALSMFAQAGLITLYEVEGKPYLAVPSETWFKYQTHIRTEKRECDRSRIPAPPGASALHSAQVREDTRECAQVRAGGVNSQPSPSPSPSLSPSQLVITDEHEIERENVRAEVAGEIPDATLAADAALSLSAPLSTTVSPQPPQSAAPPKPATAPATKRKPAKVTPLRVPGARVRDVVWDACIASMGAAPSNSVERGKWAKGIKALRESLSPPLADGSPGPEITAEIGAEIGVRARRYRMRYGSSVPLNPMALAGNWSQLAHDIPAQTTQQEGKRYGHAAGHTGHAGQFTRQAASGYTGQRRGNGKPAIGTTEYYAQALLAQQQSQQQGRNPTQAGWCHAGGRAGEDDATAAIGIG